MMDRADYESIASAINEADVAMEPKQILALEIATALCSTNDRFDPRRFLQQCDVALTDHDIALASHALYLRTKTGVGATRDEIRRTR